jgi:CheY-like chemotaxis protein
MELFVETFEARDVVKTVQSTMSRLVEDRGNRLTIDLADDLGSMTSDITKLRQTLLNLVGNANKFTDSGDVTLRARREDRSGEPWLCFAIEDTGIGMTEEQTQRLFKPFSQADASTTRKYGGTGLGLTICKHFCEMMGGYLEVESRSGQGSIFTAHLPASARDTLEARLTRTGGRETTGQVLVIDDDPAVRDLLTRNLGRRGFTVVTAENGVQGIDKAQTLRPDVIVLDVLMPGIDGWHVIAELKRLPETADIPVVMLTLVDQANVGFALGASDFILKPIVPDRVAQVVGRHCVQRLGRILVVEDDANTRDLVRRTLERDGYSVTVAENGRLALEALDHTPPDAIVLDLLMPEVDGFTFLEELRKRDAPPIPVIVATAKDLTGQERATLEARVQQIIQKGDYSGDRLLEAVSESVADAASREPSSHRPSPASNRPPPASS